MIVCALDPLRDSRWPDLVDRHPQSSAFHTSAWLSALQQTYGYRSLAFTTSAPGRSLDDGVVLCEVRSWLTGRRLVSLPFADHCDPLVKSPDMWNAISSHLDRLRHDARWDYIELRPHAQRLDSAPGAMASARFWCHDIDIRASEETLFAGLHKDSIQRKILRAKREQLSYEEGCSDALLRDFYRLLLLTRQRHQLPPQPFEWFLNLAGAFGPSMKVRVARRGDSAIAAIVTIHHRDVMLYKYGASDAAFHHLGGMHLLLWRTIQDGRSIGCTRFDLGRCDTDNLGLATFKERWGATRSEMTYWRYAEHAPSRSALRKHALNGAKRVLDHAPRVCRIAAGRFLYKHAG